MKETALQQKTYGIGRYMKRIKHLSYTNPLKFDNALKRVILINSPLDFTPYLSNILFTPFRNAPSSWGMGNFERNLEQGGCGCDWLFKSKSLGVLFSSPTIQKIIIAVLSEAWTKRSMWKFREIIFMKVRKTAVKLEKNVRHSTFQRLGTSSTLAK